MIRIMCIALLLVNVNAFSQAERKFIRKGNKLFSDSSYVDAEVLYRKALDKAPNSLGANANLGSSLYKQQKFADATKLFLGAAQSSKEKADISKNYYNLGNSLFKENKLQESIEAYKQALRNNPNDEDARHNLSYVQKLQKQQQNQQQDKKQDKKDDKNRDDQKNKDSQQNKDKQENKQDKKEDQPKEDEQQKGEDKKPAQQNKISPQQAEQMLKALENDERKLQQKMKEQKASQNQNINILKDW